MGLCFSLFPVTVTVTSRNCDISEYRPVGHNLFVFGSAVSSGSFLSQGMAGFWVLEDEPFRHGYTTALQTLPVPHAICDARVGDVTFLRVLHFDVMLHFEVTFWRHKILRS